MRTSMSPFTVDAFTGPPDDAADTRPFTVLARTSLVAPLTSTPPLHGAHAEANARRQLHRELDRRVVVATAPVVVAARAIAVLIARRVLGPERADDDVAIIATESSRLDANVLGVAASASASRPSLPRGHRWRARRESSH